MTNGMNNNTGISRDQVIGVVLAGGQGRRLGFVNKPLIDIGGKPVLAHILKKMSPQLHEIIINANAAHDEYQHFGLDIVQDELEGFLGPLSGVLTALDWAAMSRSGISHVLSFPGDAPFVPHDLAEKLIEAVNDAEAGDKPCLARAVSGGRAHPVVGLWPVSIRAELRDKLVNDDVRKIDLFTADYPMQDVSFEGVPDPFFNINTEDDVALAKRILKGAS